MLKKKDCQVQKQQKKNAIFDLARIFLSFLNVNYKKKLCVKWAVKESEGTLRSILSSL